MENKKIKNGIKDLKEITMTENEKQSVFLNIFNSPVYKDEERVKSPWGVYSVVSLMKRNQLAYFVVIPLIIILSGGSVVFASQDSLPNDILYPIKVKILEPVESALIFSQTEKAKHQSNLAKTRLVEAQTLAKEKKLDDSTEEIINKLLVSHTVALDKAINKATKSDSKKEVDEITTNFRAEMNANARILEIINEKEKEDDESLDVKEVEKENKEEDREDNHISKTARISAMSIKDTSKEEKIENKEYYKEKKEKLKLLIDDIDKNTEEKEIDEEIPSNKSNYDTHGKINEAKKYLEESDMKEIEGDEMEAHSLLLDSESLFKEAEILIQSEIDLEEEEKEVNKKYREKEKEREKDKNKEDENDD
jgi:hypothetical protein